VTDSPRDGSTFAKGRRGEEVAAAYLEAHQYRILEKNFKCRHGEVDIIAVRDDSVVFVEVKNWERMPLTELHRGFDGRRRARLRRSSQLYLQYYPVLSMFRRRYELLFLTDGGRSIRHMNVAVGE
jgi:Holliday junction resolvase-like predicted endonuclease